MKFSNPPHLYHAGWKELQSSSTWSPVSVAHALPITCTEPLGVPQEAVLPFSAWCPIQLGELQNHRSSGGSDPTPFSRSAAGSCTATGPGAGPRHAVLLRLPSGDELLRCATPALRWKSAFRGPRRRRGSVNLPHG